MVRWLRKALFVTTKGVRLRDLISLIIFHHLSFRLVHLSMCSVPELQKPAGPPEDWVEWFLHRVHQGPWALGGLVVIGLFMLLTVCLILFALLYGCCCSPQEQKKKKAGVI